MKYDVIIIGGGLGGLTAGAKLAREDKKVLLLEQHSQPGGCATSFRRGDFTLEVGLHEMDGPSPKDMKTRIFNELDVFNNVEFVKVPEFYNFVCDDLTITIPHDKSEATKILKDAFPEESDGIDAFFSQILNPKRKAENEQVKDICLGEFLDRVIKNDSLKLVLLGNLGYFHDDPYSISLTYYSVAQGSYYTGGASFIKGGSQILSDHLAGYITSHGGEVLLGHIVTGFITENGRLTGITYNRKRASATDPLKAYATEIIANASIPQIADLLPAENGKKLNERIKDLRPGASLLTVYFGFSKPLSQLGYKHYSTFVYDGSVKNQSDIFHNNHSDFDRRSFTFIDYGQIDSGLAPEGKDVGAICCIDYIDGWQNLSRGEYETKKEEVARTFIKRLDKLIPGISEVIEYYEVGTPLTVKRYTLNPGGAVYGFAQVPGKSAVDFSDVYDNLHFASAWGKTGGGFSGVIYSGFLCAYNILRKR